MGEGFTFGGREIRWGAVADHPEGPYVKSAWHPVTKRPRGVCVDLSRRCRFVDDGRPEKNTFQYAPDGVNFEIVAVLKGAPEALGPFRPAKPSDTDPFDGIRWGLCHVSRGLAIHPSFRRSPAAPPLTSQREATVPDRPNILLLLTDQQRADTIGAWGYDHMVTPAMDDLVRDGFSFRNAFCPGATCMASRAAIFILLPSSSGAKCHLNPPSRSRRSTY